MKYCQRCDAPLRFEPTKGHLHPGGGLYVQRCNACGHTHDGPTLPKCPKCGSQDKWVDDHIAQPIER